MFLLFILMTSECGKPLFINGAVYIAMKSVCLKRVKSVKYKIDTVIIFLKNDLLLCCFWMYK